MGHELKIAFVQDALPFQGGAEKVLAAALEVFPQAPVYTLVYNREAFQGTVFERHLVKTSFIDRLPGAHGKHRAYLPLMPLAIERFDLSGFDIVLSFSYAVAHAAPTRPDQLHISYIHTPMRYAWRPQIISQVFPGTWRWLQWFSHPFFHLFRRWDTAMIKRSAYLLTNSQWMAGCIWNAYHLQAEVLFPPVDTDRFIPKYPRGEYYIYAGRLAALKRLDIVVQAFNRLGRSLLIIGEGPEKDRLREIAGPNVKFLGWQAQEHLASLLGKAKAFVHVCEEDFGIALAEAQAAGCPVIALRRGAASEIISDGLTGLLFEEQTVEDLCAAVERFESQGVDFGPEQIRKSVLRFDQQCFKQGLENCVHEKWAAFQSGQKAGQPESFPYADTVMGITMGSSESIYGRGD